MVIDLIYRVLMKIFTCDISMNAENAYVTKTIQAIIHFMYLLQNIRLFWYPFISISRFDSYLEFWVILSFSSIDPIFAKLDLLEYFIYTSIALASTTTISLLIAYALVRNKKNLSAVYCKLIRLQFKLSSIFFIPITISLAMMLKYSAYTFDTIQEYDSTIKASRLNFGHYGIVFGIILLTLHYIMSLIYECCSFDIAHSLSNISTNCKSTCIFDVFTKTVSFINSILYVFMIQTHYPEYIVILSVLHSVLIFRLIYYLPYYSNYMNFLKILVQIQSTLVSIFFLIGFIMNDSSVPFLLTIVIQPFITMLLSSGIQFRLKIFLSGSPSNDFLLFELALRSKIISGAASTELIKAFNKNYSVTKEKSNLVIQAYYCSDKLEDPMLGLLKISRVNHYDFSLFSNFQVFKCKEILQEINSKTSQCFKQYKYLLEFQKTKEADMEFCERFLNFLDKILEKNVELSKLKIFVEELMGSAGVIKEKYEMLMKLAPNSKILLEMYSSLLVEVLNDQERGKVIHEKKNALITKGKTQKGDYSIKDEESICILIVSGNKSTIGKIIYANLSMIKLLGCTEESIKDCYLNQFVPKPFDKNHDLRLLKFIENAESSKVFRKTPLFLLNSQGFLIECYFNSECIGYEGETNFLSITEPIIEKRRECAIINNQGMIYSHSQRLPKILGLSESYIEGRCIDEFIPDFVISGIDCNRLWIGCSLFSGNDRLAIVIKEKIIGSTNFLVIYATNRDSEIIKWSSRGLKIREKDATDNELFSFGYSDKSINIQSIAKISEVKFGETRIDNEEQKEEFIDDKKFNTHTSSVQRAQNAQPKYLKNALRSLNTMQYLVLASVKTIQVITIIIYNIIILVYISQAVNHANSLNALNQLGDLAYSIAQLTLISRNIDLSLMKGAALFYTVAELESKLNDTIMIHDEMLNEYDNWSFCKFLRIVNHPLVSYWTYEDRPNVNFASLHDIIRLLIQNTKDYIQALKTGDRDSKLFFIIYNGMGKSYFTARDALDELNICENDQVENLNNSRLILMIIAIVISGFLGVFLSLYVISTDKALNRIWETLRKNVNSIYHELRQTLTDRMFMYHSQERVYDLIESNLTQKSTLLKYSHSVRYLKRFFFFFLFAGVSYLVTSYVFYENIHSYLIYRPTLMHAIISRRFTIVELCFYSNEQELDGTYLSLNERFNDFQPLSTPVIGYNRALNSLLKTKNVMRDPKITKFMSRGLKEMIFEKIVGVPEFLSKGTYPAMAFLNMESLFITFNNIVDSSEAIGNYIEQINVMSTQLKYVILWCDDNSRKATEAQMSNLIYFIIGFSLFFILIYFFYYRSYLNSEREILINLTKIIAILPQKAPVSIDNTSK